MKELKKKLWLQALIIYTRYILGGTFVFASLIKIKGKRFTTDSGINEPIDSAWHFFETIFQSGLYWKFIGISQLISGLLLMTQKYSKLGALMYLPIILNIFLITISYYFAYTPIITGLMLLANLLLIIWDWDTLQVLINKKPYFSIEARLENDIVWQIIGLVMFLFTFFYRLKYDTYDLFLWFIVCFIIGVIGLLIGLKRKMNYE